MDNQTIDVTSEGGEGIALALGIIWRKAAPGGKATHYKVIRTADSTSYYGKAIAPSDTGNVDGVPGVRVRHYRRTVESADGVQTLILLWHEEQGSTPLPFALDCKRAAEFITNWLGQADYGRQPDHDGDNGKGWRLFTESWGHVAGHHYAIIGVQPAWAMYGK